MLMPGQCVTVGPGSCVRMGYCGVVLSLHRDAETQATYLQVTGATGAGVAPALLNVTPLPAGERECSP